MITDIEISCVLGTYNRLSFLKLAIESIRQELTNLSHEIIVIDGGSDDGTLEWLITQKDIITIVQHNRIYWNGKLIQQRSWGYFMNLGFKSASGKYVCMLSDDCLVVPGGIMNGYKLFEEKLTASENIGSIAFYWRNWPEDKQYSVCTTLSDKLYVNHGMYLKKALIDVNYIDEITCQFYHADCDLGLKMWLAGYQCIESPDSYIEHYSHANPHVRKLNSQTYYQDWPNFIKKWKDIYYFSAKDCCGRWLKKDFSDCSQTYTKFISILGNAKI